MIRERAPSTIVKHATDSLDEGEAARRLGIPPAALLTWERQFGFPAGQSGTDGQRRFAADEISALRNALMGALSITAAVRVARARARAHTVTRGS